MPSYVRNRSNLGTTINLSFNMLIDCRNFEILLRTIRLFATVQFHPRGNKYYGEPSFTGKVIEMKVFNEHDRKLKAVCSAPFASLSKYLSFD